MEKWTVTCYPNLGSFESKKEAEDVAFMSLEFVPYLFRDGIVLIQHNLDDRMSYSAFMNMLFRVYGHTEMTKTMWSNVAKSQSIYGFFYQHKTGYSTTMSTLPFDLSEGARILCNNACNTLESDMNLHVNSFIEQYGILFLPSQWGIRFSDLVQTQATATLLRSTLLFTNNDFSSVLTIGFDPNKPMDLPSMKASDVNEILDYAYRLRERGYKVINWCDIPNTGIRVDYTGDRNIVTTVKTFIEDVYRRSKPLEKYAERGKDYVIRL